MKHYLTIGAVMVLTILLALWAVYSTKNNVADVPVPSSDTCTPGSQVCPDGTVVERGGPKCEFAACPTTKGPTGVVGKVTVGPSCPVERVPADPACKDSPLAANIVVFRASSGYVAAKGRSDPGGNFTFSLPQGSYTIQTGDGARLPRCPSTNITVAATGYTSTTISCDSGIR